MKLIELIQKISLMQKKMKLFGIKPAQLLMRKGFNGIKFWDFFEIII